MFLKSHRFARSAKLFRRRSFNVQMFAMASRLHRSSNIPRALRGTRELRYLRCLRFFFFINVIIYR